MRFSEKLLERSGISVETLDLSEVFGRIERLVEFCDINQVMLHASAFGGCGFGGADVEPAIDLHGIHGDDFATDLFSEQ